MPGRTLDNIVNFEGCTFLKYRLVLSTLSGRPLRVTNIRNIPNDPGLKEHEINLIQLLDKLTHGSRVEINEPGTSLYYIPGTMEGGEVEHECHPNRGIAYYLEAVMILAPYCRNQVNLKLTGVTNCATDMCVDRIKLTAVPILEQFLYVKQPVEINIEKRGAPPLGGGIVVFKCPTVRSLIPVQLFDNGTVKQIEGYAQSIKVSSALASRLAESAEGVLLNFTPNVNIKTASEKSRSSAYSITLVAETTSGVFYCGEACSPVMNTGTLVRLPEDLGKQASLKLIDEIYRSGCIDSYFQSMTIIFMALAKHNRSKITVGTLTGAGMQCLQDIKSFFDVQFKLYNVGTKEGRYRTHITNLCCIGIGFLNPTWPPNKKTE